MKRRKREVSIGIEEDDEKEELFMVIEIAVPVDNETQTEEFEQLLDQYIIAAPTREKRELETANEGKTYSPIPPPCVPAQITSLCSHACDHPGVTALVIFGLTIIIVVEVIALCFCGSLIHSLVARCRGRKEDHQYNTEPSVDRYTGPVILSGA